MRIVSPDLERLRKPGRRRDRSRASDWVASTTASRELRERRRIRATGRRLPTRSGQQSTKRTCSTRGVERAPEDPCKEPPPRVVFVLGDHRAAKNRAGRCASSGVRAAALRFQAHRSGGNSSAPLRSCSPRSRSLSSLKRSLAISARGRWPLWRDVLSPQWTRSCRRATGA